MTQLLHPLDLLVVAGSALVAAWALVTAYLFLSRVAEVVARAAVTLIEKLRRHGRTPHRNH